MHLLRTGFLRPQMEREITQVSYSKYAALFNPHTQALALNLTGYAVRQLSCPLNRYKRIGAICR